MAGRIYDLRAWKRIRAEFLAAHPLCVMCEREGRVKPAHHVDHIHPISKGGSWDDPANLQGLCAGHHSQKTAIDEGRQVRMGCGTDGLPLDPSHHWA